MAIKEDPPGTRVEHWLWRKWPGGHNPDEMRGGRGVKKINKFKIKRGDLTLFFCWVALSSISVINWVRRESAMQSAAE